jgi:proteasome activator subunit 3 (PA28 gamma)
MPYSRIFFRALQNIIDSTSSPESQFHESHAVEYTDTNIYVTAPNTNDSGQKKRKRADGTDVATENGGQNARFTGSILANKNMRDLHQIVKAEAELLVDYCVRSHFMGLHLSLCWNLAQTQALG